MNITSSFYSRHACSLLGAAIGLSAGLGTGAFGAVIVLDDFEIDEGHFFSNPNTGSGTSQGFFKATPAVIATAERVTTDFFDGLAAQFITLDDDPTVPGSPAAQDSWRLRHLSGGGTIANNVPLTISGGTSYVGYWLKTFTAGLEAGIGIDDAAALEIGRWQSVPADGQWHLYEWRLQDANDWDGFAGIDPNGMIDNATVTIDALFIRGGVGFPTGGDFNAQFYVDRVAFNPDGSIAVPEPASVAFVALGGAFFAGRRRRPAAMA